MAKNSATKARLKLVRIGTRPAAAGAPGSLGCADQQGGPGAHAHPGRRRTSDLRWHRVSRQSRPGDRAGLQAADRTLRGQLRSQPGARSDRAAQSLVDAQRAAPATRCPAAHLHGAGLAPGDGRVAGVPEPGPRRRFSQGRSRDRFRARACRPRDRGGCSARISTACRCAWWPITTSRGCTTSSTATTSAGGTSSWPGTNGRCCRIRRTRSTRFAP